MEMDQAFHAQIEVIEHLQELHQHLESLTFHWLSPGAGDLSRHLLNLPRLESVGDSEQAQILIGSSDHLARIKTACPYLLLSDKGQPSARSLTALLSKGYRRQGSRLLMAIHKTLPVSQRLKILVITNLYPPQELGGYGRSIFDFALNLSCMGHQTYVVTSNAPYLGGDLKGERSVNRGLLLKGSYEGQVSAIADADQLTAISAHNLELVSDVINDFQPDTALLGNMDFLGPDLLQLLAGRAIPIWHHYGFSDPSALPYPVTCMPPPSCGYQPLANSYFTARSLASTLSAFGPLPVIYPGAQTHLYADINPPSLGGPLRIAFAGLLMGVKGPHVLLEALARLKSLGVPFTCELAGGWIDNHFYQQLVDYAHSAGIAQSIHFLGKLERYQLRELFSRNQIFVFPSTWEEPFGISQVEALAAGLLVVSSGTGGAGETVHDDINGRRFRPSDSQHLAAILHEIYCQPAEHEPLRSRGRRLAQSHFDTTRESVKLSDLMVKRLVRL